MESYPLVMSHDPLQIASYKDRLPEGVKHCRCFSGITSADWLPGQDAGP